MAIIRSVRGFDPKFGKDCFLAETAVIIGDVEMGNECSIWYSAVLRGDVNSIRLGNRVNVQDGAVIHTLYQRSQTHIGDNVTIGHNATVHGAIIKNNVLVGIGATVLDNAVVNENTIIAANSLVLTNAVLEPNSVYAGVPAKKVKEIEPNQSIDMIQRIAKDYVMYASWYNEEK
jgi:carbonic anhydrase/acetyltransferase-like protein (isoleucine patch superfamily)